MRTEEQIITQAFYLIEQDDDVWEEDSSDYIVARGYLNMGVSRWEQYENTTWRELYSSLAVAVDGDKTITSSYSYDCPTNFSRPVSWVRTGASPRFWKVVPVERVASLADSKEDFCYFMGDEANGFTLNFNPNVTLPVGETISYEYYKKATITEDPADKVEMSDPYFLAYFIAAHMGEDGIDQDKFTIAEARLEGMRTRNMSGVFGVPDTIEQMDDFSFGE